MDLSNLKQINIKITKSPYLIYDETIIGKPICSEEIVVGVVTSVDDAFVYGIVDKDKLQLVDTRMCSLELEYKD